MNNNGFTLIEMLIVLIIIGLIFFIMSFNYLTVYYKVDLENEAKFLGSTIEVLKLNSLVSNTSSKVSIEDDGFECYIDGKEIYEHKFPSNIEVQTNFSNNEISINNDGRVGRGGNIVFSSDGDSVSLIINISMGRYQIE